jgi:Protein of unknown function (DUF2950)
MKPYLGISKYLMLPLLSALLVPCIVNVTGCRSESSSKVSAAETQTTFATPEEAGQALQNAARNGDEVALAHILGPDAWNALNSGDPKEDKAALASFVAKFDKMNRWVDMTDGTKVLHVGADNYQYPIPLAEGTSSRWYFDSASGKDEIFARRIGENELQAIEAAFAIANDQDFYFITQHDGDAENQHAKKLIGAPGKQDGLYKPASKDQPSNGQAYASKPVSSGYLFRILSVQGANPKGGAQRSLAHGKQKDSFAILATPVAYADSGVMTFLITNEGAVYERDLGTKTREIANAMTIYDPDGGWIPAK